MSTCPPSDIDRADIRLIAFYQPYQLPPAGAESGDAPPHGTSHVDSVSSAEEIEEQAILAARYGIDGFCYHYRYSDSKQFSENPVRTLLSSRTLEFPFCLCWSNGNWTPRSDAPDSETPLSPHHSDDSEMAFIMDVASFFSDDRYIRVAGKPLLLIQSIDVFPDIIKTTSNWRKKLREEGFGEVFLACRMGSAEYNPPALGFDAAFEIPTFHLASEILNVQVDGPNIGGRYDYETAINSCLEKAATEYILFRGVTPGGNNTSARHNESEFFLNSSPEKYEFWLAELVRQARHRPPDSRLIFVDSWNDYHDGWQLGRQEGCGQAYLEATQRAKNGTSKEAGLFLEKHRYTAWKRGRIFDDHIVALHKEHLGKAGPLPRFNVFVFDHGGGEDLLASTINSITKQKYPISIITIVSNTPPPWSEKHERLRWVTVDSSSPPISATVRSNSHPDELIWLLSSGSQLVTRAFWRCAEHAFRNCEEKLFYTDDEIVDGEGKTSPRFKPDFNLDFLRSLGYIGEAACIRGSFLFGIDDNPCDTIEDFISETSFRAFECHGAQSIGHISDVLLSQMTLSPHANQSLGDRTAVVRRHIDRIGGTASIVDGLIPGSLRVLHHHSSSPLVSIIVPTRDQLPLLQRCIESVLEKTGYENYEILIVDNDSQTREARQYLEALAQIAPGKISVLSYPHPFNFSAMNNLAAQSARGEYLLLLNNDTAALHSDWLDAMMVHALRPEVGVVGARLLFSDATIQHAGVVVGLSGMAADHVFAGARSSEPGYMGRTMVEQNYSAVTAACMLVRRSIYQTLGGLDERDFKVLFNDIDFCLRVREAGYLVVWTPYATLLHDGSASLKKPSVEARNDLEKKKRTAHEISTFYRTWRKWVGGDPAYNKNLSLRRHQCQVQTDPIINWNPVPWNPLKRVLAFRADNSGCSHYRIMTPLKELSRQQKIIGMVSSAHYEPAEIEQIAPDTIVIQRQLKQDVRLELYKAYGKAFRVYEIDDLITNFPERCAHRIGFGPETQNDLIRSIGFCDRLVVSTQPLADAFGRWANDVKVAHNYLDRKSWETLQPKKRQGKKPRVGWAGAGGHDGDIEMMFDVVKSLFSEVEWIFMGMCPEILRPYAKEIHGWSSIDEYPKHLASLNLDLAIAPLVQHPFNEAKSNIKILEYGAIGYPVVCSDILPYQDPRFPIERVKNKAKEWISSIREHVNDLDEAERRGAALKLEIHQNFFIDQHIGEWQEAWLRAPVC